jgi:hypothetical protein
MEISPVAGASSGGNIQAQAQLQKKASSQQEDIVQKIIQGTEESTDRAQATGRKTLAVA